MYLPFHLPLHLRLSSSLSLPGGCGVCGVVCGDCVVVVELLLWCCGVLCGWCLCVRVERGEKVFFRLIARSLCQSFVSSLSLQKHTHPQHTHDT